MMASARIFVLLAAVPLLRKASLRQGLSCGRRKGPNFVRRRQLRCRHRWPKWARSCEQRHRTIAGLVRPLYKRDSELSCRVVSVCQRRTTAILGRFIAMVDRVWPEAQVVRILTADGYRAGSQEPTQKQLHSEPAWRRLSVCSAETRPERSQRLLQRGSRRVFGPAGKSASRHIFSAKRAKKGMMVGFSQPPRWVSQRGVVKWWSVTIGSRPCSVMHFKNGAIAVDGGNARPRRLPGGCDTAPFHRHGWLFCPIAAAVFKSASALFHQSQALPAVWRAYTLPDCSHACQSLFVLPPST